MQARRYWGLAGLVCVAVGVALGELLAAFTSPAASPVSAVGQAVIGLLPGQVKEWAIHLFGTADKTVLLLTMVLVMALLAFVAGVVEKARRGMGMVLIGAFGVVGLAAVAVNAQASILAYAAPIVAAGVAMGLLSWVRGRFLDDDLALHQAAELRAAKLAADSKGGSGKRKTPTSTPAAIREASAREASRRKFLVTMGTGAALAVVAGGASTIFRRASVVVTELRAMVRLPMPKKAAAPIPAGAQLDIAGITPLVTDPETFYRIDTALVVPAVNSDTWTVKVTGMVEREITLNYEQLLAKPMVEEHITIGCVSNEVGGGLVGNARWLGWPVRELLAEAGVLPGADMVLSRSTDGFTAGTPLEAMTDDRNSMIAVGMDGEPLSLVHGYPARMVVPGLYGYVSATKWLMELKVTTFAADQGYWTPLGWSALGPIKTASRIDVPRSGAKPSAGQFTAAGVAWAPERGISAVEVALDGGPWVKATLAEAINKDTWVQWKVSLDLAAGGHELKVRAVDGEGTVQTATPAAPAPNGASGHHTVNFTAQ